MDRTYFFDRVYPLQDAVLGEMAEADTAFYLTGDTAALRGYLGQRFSDDLGFFVNDAPLFALWSDRVTSSLAARAEWTIRVLLCDSRFVRLEVVASEVGLKLDLVNDARRLLTASEAAWRVIRWIEPADLSSYLSDLQRLGEALLLLSPPA